MGKNDPFKNKPTPPRKEHVLADLANADESDIVFTTSYPAPGKPIYTYCDIVY